ADLRRQLDLSRGLGGGERAVGHPALAVTLRLVGEGAGAEDVVDVGIVDAVEEVESLRDELQPAPSPEAESFGEAQVHGEGGGQVLGVAAQAGGGIGGVA